MLPATKTTPIHSPITRFGLVAIVMAAWPMVASVGAGEATMEFVTRRGDRLYEGDEPLRFVSFNIPNLHLAEDAISFLGESPWRWPNEYEVADALESIRQMNGRVARTYVLSVRRETSDMGDCVHVTAPGEFNEEAFEALDLVMKVAGEKGVRVILPLVDNWKWWGGAEQYAAFRGKPAESFWTDPQLIDDFKKTIDHVVNRRNTLTGKLYRDDPALFGWETGNEIYPPAEWTRQIAAHIKSLDSNHLVLDGKSLDGLALTSLDDPNIDVLSTHHYPGRGEDIPAAVAKAIRQTAGKKPYFVGEVGFLPTDQIAPIIHSVHESHAAGVLLWSLRPHRREGGFYWHSEPMADGRYKAYHWPGFDSGERYDERSLLRLMRESSYRLRGEELVAPPAPDAPLLLPIEDVAAISWRGSTGASGYDVQRAAQPDGPWETIASDVSDAATPYRPLYADTGAEIGSQPYYRVIAKNESGASPPSNVVGPVRVEWLTLVDELADLDKIASRAGELQQVTDSPRAAQEDVDRVALSPGARIAYQAPGRIERVTVYAFVAEGDGPGVHIAPSEKDQPLANETGRDSPQRAAGDYGYYKPIRVQVASTGGQGSWAIISAPAGETCQIARVEVRYSSP